ncbi:MAG: pentapeptide repeat-containing protein [Planctomycetaceae bacterium]|nr:pentapeptide repeat-containing protein [Planctomycetaceae bacterium]
MVEKHVKRGETSKIAFHYELAVEAFGEDYMEYLEKEKKDFQGDWFLLAFLLRCHETKKEERGRGIGAFQRCSCPFCRNNWKDINFNIDIHLERVELVLEDFENANLIGANLSNANLNRANLKNADLFYARLEGDTNLEFSNLTNANLVGVNLANANLLCADLTNANLDFANLTGVQLRRASLDGTDVRGAKGIVFDSNRVERLLIEGNAPDPWSVLRRTYTGPWFFLHLLFLVAFLLPYIGSVIVLTSIHRGMELIDKYPDTNYPALQQLQTWYQGIDKQHAFWTLIGFTDYNLTTICFFTLTVIVVVYNIFRYLLTMKVNLLREAEERAKITPGREEYMGKADRKYDLCSIWSRSFWIATGEAWKEWKSAFIGWCKEWKKSFTPADGEKRDLFPKSPIPSLITYLGLFRFHKIANVLISIVYFALVLQAIRWIFFTQIPVLPPM